MINLSRTTAVSSGDLVVLFKTNSGDYRGINQSDFTTWLNSVIETPGEYATQYYAPSSTGFTATITDNAENTHLILTPTGAFAAGSIVLPTAPADKQMVLVNCTQDITALTITSGVTVTGAPTTITANDYFTLKYDSVTATWYRVA